MVYFDLQESDPTQFDPLVNAIIEKSLDDWLNVHCYWALSKEDNLIVSDETLPNYPHGLYKFSATNFVGAIDEHQWDVFPSGVTEVEKTTIGVVRGVGLLYSLSKSALDLPNVLPPGTRATLYRKIYCGFYDRFLNATPGDFLIVHYRVIAYAENALSPVSEIVLGQNDDDDDDGGSSGDDGDNVGNDDDDDDGGSSGDDGDNVGVGRKRNREDANADDDEGPPRKRQKLC